VRTTRATRSGAAGGLLMSCAERQPQPPLAPAAAIGAGGADAAPALTLSLEVLDVTWQWVSFRTPVEQIDVDAPERYTIQFARAGRVAVRADCNRGATSYTSPRIAASRSGPSRSRARCARQDRCRTGLPGRSAECQVTS
jgi:hypothetical protein